MKPHWCLAGVFWSSDSNLSGQACHEALWLEVRQATPYGCSWTAAFLTKAPCSTWDELQGSRLDLLLLEILTGIPFSADTNLALFFFFLTFLGSTKAGQKCRSRWRAQLEELGNLFDVESCVLFIHLGWAQRLSGQSGSSRKEFPPTSN